ncbi:MAG: aminotransferase class I/II-fold pyridoxal phosphate-dependent enzyme [Lachnospiraceae bacterium]|nr:aminotransferase class I/II-fold pyridoxal phosphate-dependent enzyme [Lachnospiraceae bacterium]
MKDKKLLLDRLKEYADRGVLPMHMPGHKRNTVSYPWLKELGGAYDVTEIEGFDDLVEVDCRPGVRSFLSVNGSTGGILAAVRTAVRPGDLLLMGRNCHRSVYHAAEICGARVRYLMPDWDEEFGIFSRVQPGTVEEALKVTESEREKKLRAFPELEWAFPPEEELKKQDLPAAVVITSPTYEGDVSDIRSIAQICHSRGIPLIVDEAHGAHFGLPGFPDSAIDCGADIVVQSLHKTLPSPTQTAVVHCRSSLLSADELRRQLLMFQTSSPSFLLMAAAEKAIDYVKKRGEEEADAWIRRNVELWRSIERLPGLKLRMTDDGSKLLIASGIPGEQWMKRLREEYSIEAEMAVNDAVLFLTGMGDDYDSMEQLSFALMMEDRLLPPYEPVSHPAPALPEKVMEPWEASRLPKVICPIKKAAGWISADYGWKYPPGIPFLVPGERIGADAVEKAAGLGMRTLQVLR